MCQDEADERSRRQLRAFLKTTTFHGIDQLFQSRSWARRVFWFATIVAVLVMVTVQLKTLIKYFVNDPSVTSIQVNYPKVGFTLETKPKFRQFLGSGLVLPSITVCTLLKLNRTAVQTLYPGVDTSMAELAMANFWSPYSTALTDVDYFPKTRNETARSIETRLKAALGNVTILQFIKETSFGCEGQFLLCWFENGNVFDCCSPSSLFTMRRHLTHSGTCFEFEHRNTSQRLPGPVGGLGFVYWYPNQHLYTTAFNSYNEFALHLFTSPADAMLEKNPLMLPIGYHSKINMQASHISRRATDEMGRQRCENRRLKYFRTYTYQTCQVECLIDTELNYCHCTGVHDMADLPLHQLCDPAEAMECYKRTAHNFSDLLVKCRHVNCSEECDYWTYAATLTVSRVVNPCCEKEMLKYWRLPPGDPFQSLVVGEVYFGEIQYTQVSERSAYTIETFVSSIGGAMGLWTGASIITWIHLVYFCCMSCVKKFRERRSAELERRAPPSVETSCRPCSMAAADANGNRNTGSSSTRCSQSAKMCMKRCPPPGQPVGKRPAVRVSLHRHHNDVLCNSHAL